MSDKQTYEEAALPVQSPRHTAFKTAFIYASISVIWILFSDQLLSIFVKDIEAITRMQMVKGWFFVLATSYLIFLLLQKDIKKYCQVEEALRHSQEQLLSLMDAMPIALAWAGEQGDIQYSNNKFRELFGYALEDMPTVEQWFQLAYPDQEYRQTVVSNWQIAVENAQNSGPEIAPIEATIACKDGSTRYVAVVGTLIQDRILAVFNDLTESKRAEDALRESEKKYRQLVESTNDWVWSCDLNGTHLFSNQAVKSVLGYEPDEIIGKSAFDFMHPEDIEQAQKIVQQASNHKKGWQFDKIRWLHKDGVVRYVESRAEPILDTEGNITGFSGIDRDVSERKKAEENLIQEKAFTEAILNSLPGGFYLYDENLRLIRWNNNFEKYTGYTTEELFHKSSADFFEGEDIDKIAQAVDQVFNEGETEVEAYVTNKDGTKAPHFMTGSLFTQNSKNYILGVSFDITERKQAEEALKETEKKLEAIINHHFQLTGMLDVQGRLIMANETALKYLNVAESDVIGKLFWETPWWSHSREEQDKLQKAIHRAGKSEFVRFETSHLNLNGELRIMDFSINPVIDDEGNVKHLIPAARDITDLKDAEESLRQSESQLRTLANRLQEVEEAARKALARELHDQVGQSLTALNINLNILRNRLPPDTLEHLEERLDDSIDLVEETTKTIRDVMAELRPSVLDDYGLTAALRWYGKRFSDRTGISIKLKMDEMSSRLAETVESALFRITQEALTNVAKHANASELVLTFEETNGLLRFIIADNGKGFDYTAFSKAGVRTGWGILNMQERIQVLGGRFQIDSEPGKGTSVSIEIRKESYHDD